MIAAPRHQTRQAGFTLIEMIVVLVVLGLAMAVVFPTIGNIYRGSARGAAASQASGEAGVAARLLEEDIRTALGDRGTGERTDTNVVGAKVATIPALTLGAGSDAHSDIVQAGPLELHLNADVLNVAGVERVVWRLVQDNAACGDRDRSNRNWCLTRTVTGPNGAGARTTEVVTKGRGTYPTTSSCAPPLAASVRVFCYEESYPTNGSYTWNTWNASCTSGWLADGNSPNTGTRTLRGVGQRIATRHNMVEQVHSIARLDRVVTVGASLLSGGGFGNAGERSYENVQIAVRAREGEAYREAIMCGLRAGWGR